VIGGNILALTANNVFGVRLISKRIRPKLIGAVRSLIWNSRLGEWAARLLTPKHRTTVAELDYRPTEMALSVAASELFAALPASYREHMPDLPKVVERLEAHAAASRARVEEMNAMMALGGGHSQSAPANLVAARDAAKRELADAVASLEAVRLDLLRLHGGAVDLRPITTVLEAARELGEQLDRLNDAQREVDEIAHPVPLDLRPHTPV
jgi:serine/threonine-protein kinase